MLCAPFYTMLCTCLVKTLYGINYNNNNDHFEEHFYNHIFSRTHCLHDCDFCKGQDIKYHRMVQNTHTFISYHVTH